jgi:hypothetical protein
MTLGTKEEYFTVNLMVKLKVIKKYKDIELERSMLVGEDLEVSRERAEVLLSKGFVKIIKISKLNNK